MQKISNARILVTGGAGFIGSNLCEILLQQKNEVVCLDNLSTGKKENIAPLLSNKYFTFIEGDIRNFVDCQKAAVGIDFVLHQAALGSVPRSIANPIATNEVNINGFVNMLHAAVEAKVKRFVYASSSSVYGDHPALPKKEDLTGSLLSPYAVSKYANELYAQVFGKLYGIACVGLRYFNVYGKNQNPEGEYSAVIPRFIRQLIKHESPIIFGDGSQSRDFTYIEDVLQANQLAALATHPEASNQVYNVAYHGQTSLNQLFDFLVTYLQKYDDRIAHLRPTYTQARQGDVKHSFASIHKAQELLGYQPKFSIKEGLANTIDWYYKNV
jgi:UDP-N-acetylglucosamine/UDP-N-acetylgalactosamine 4-epimerase